MDVMKAVLDETCRDLRILYGRMYPLESRVEETKDAISAIEEQFDKRGLATLYSDLQLDLQNLNRIVDALEDRNELIDKRLKTLELNSKFVDVTPSPTRKLKPIVSQLRRRNNSVERPLPKSNTGLKMRAMHHRPTELSSHMFNRQR